MRLVYCNQVDHSEASGQGRHELEMARRLLTDESIDGVYVGQAPSQNNACLNYSQAYYIPLKKNTIGLLAYQLKLFFKLYSLTRDRQDVVVFARYAPAMIAPALIALLRSVPLIVRTGPVLDNLETYGKSNGLFTRAFIRATSLLHYKVATRILVVTRTIARYVVREFAVSEQKIVVSGNGYDNEIFTFTSTPEIDLHHIRSVDFKIVFAGSLSPEQGVVELVMSIIELRLEGECVAGIIIGSGPESNKISKLIDENGMKGSFLLTGKLGQNDVSSYLNASDLAAATFSVEGLKRTGSAAIKIYEYLAVGLRVLATSHEDHRFIDSNDLGSLCDSSDRESIKSAIRQEMLKRSPISERTRISTFAKERGTWEEAYLRLRKVCAEAVS